MPSGRAARCWNERGHNCSSAETSNARPRPRSCWEKRRGCRGMEMWVDASRARGGAPPRRAGDAVEGLCPLQPRAVPAQCRPQRRGDRSRREALAMAEQLGLDELCANALCTLGVARAETGDLGGVEDLERSIVIAQAGAPGVGASTPQPRKHSGAARRPSARVRVACARTPGCGAVRRSRRDPVAPGGTAVRGLLVRPH